MINEHEIEKWLNENCNYKFVSEPLFVYQDRFVQIETILCTENTILEMLSRYANLNDKTKKLFIYKNSEGRFIDYFNNRIKVRMCFLQNIEINKRFSFKKWLMNLK